MTSFTADQTIARWLYTPLAVYHRRFLGKVCRNFALEIARHAAILQASLLAAKRGKGRGKMYESNSSLHFKNKIFSFLLSSFHINNLKE
jgi:hypothetical protein